MIKYFKYSLSLSIPLLILAGCGSESDRQLNQLITEQTLNKDIVLERGLPDITDPIARLGMKLFFSKSLGGGFDSACVSCHHPAMGGGDQLSLPVGVDAVSPDLLGPGRENSLGYPVVPRNAPTVFNAGLWDTGLFLDSRVESLGKEANANGSLSGIRTPDSAFGFADANAGQNLAAAQARFPVTSNEEMKTAGFEAGSSNDTIREHLAARIGGYGEAASELEQNEWLEEFQAAFVTSEPAETLITFDNIAHALGEYERSMVFVNNPWRRYMDGDNNALSEDQKQGAILFFGSIEEGGAGCSACHSGSLLSDGRHHTLGFPQIGPGKGDGADDDFGRERETGQAQDRYRFRTPSLLNVALTAPYGHAGAYESLDEVVRHYNNPRGTVDAFFNRGGWCRLPQFVGVENCEALYPNARSNSELALNKLQQEQRAGTSLFQPTRLDNEPVGQIVAFLQALTDDCAADRACIDAWVPDTDSSGPDGQQLNAVSNNGVLL